MSPLPVRLLLPSGAACYRRVKMMTNKETRRAIRASVAHDGHQLFHGLRKAYGWICPVWVEARGARPTRREINRAIRSAIKLERANMRAFG